MNTASRRSSPLFRTALIFFFPLVCACGPAEHKSSSESPAAPSASPSPPERIVSLVPSLTEMVYALGEQDRLVAVSQYCKFPPEAQEKPQVGALVSVNYEKILILSPDLVILRPDQAEAERKLASLGVPSVRIPAESLANVFTSIEQLGDILGKPDQAAALNEKIHADLAAIRAESGRGIMGREKPRVLLVVGRNPGTLQQIYAAGSGSFLVELMEMSGARSVLVDSHIPWPVVSKESILKLDPDVILDGSMRRGSMADGPGPHMDAWNELPMLSAVKNGRVVPFGDEHATIPGPSVARSARLIRDLIAGAYSDPSSANAASSTTATPASSPPEK